MIRGSSAACSASGNRPIGGAGADELRQAAFAWRLIGAHDGERSGHSLKRGVRVPHIVAGQELGLAVIIAKLGAIWLHIANGAEILNATFLTQRHMAWFGCAEALVKAS